MEQELRTQMQASDQHAAQINANQSEWPTTAAPKQYTQTPMPVKYTNPPVVLPGDMGPAPPTKAPEPSSPMHEADATPNAGTGSESDFRTDLSEYHLVVVKDKDVPNTAGYNPREKLKWFPRGRLPGSGETFYVVTHRFADRANINSEFRGDVVVHSDSTGHPRAPLAVGAEMSASGGSENFTGTPMPFVFPTSTWVAVIVITLLVVYIIVLKYRKDRKPYDEMYGGGGDGGSSGLSSMPASRKAMRRMGY